MKINLYSIYDRTAEESGPIFQAKNNGVAWRQFDNLVVERKINMEEFRLFNLGTYDTETQIIEQNDIIEVEPQLSLEVE